MTIAKTIAYMQEEQIQASQKPTQKINSKRAHEKEESNSEIPEKKPYLWKLVKAKFMLTFRLCDDCHSVLFNNPGITEPMGDKVQVKFLLCARCVETNCRATDILAPPKKKIN